MSRATQPEDAKEFLWLAGIDTEVEDTLSDEVLSLFDLETVKDKELLLGAAISTLDFGHLEDVVQNRLLYWLDRVASKRPTVILHL